MTLKRTRPTRKDGDAVTEATTSEIVVDCGRDGERLLVRPWLAENGRVLVTIAWQYRDHFDVWHLRRSGFALTPATARALVPALLACAEQVDATEGGEL